MPQAASGPVFRIDQADHQRCARLNCISLSMFDYDEQDWTSAKPGTPDVLEFKHTVPSVY